MNFMRQSYNLELGLHLDISFSSEITSLQYQGRHLNKCLVLGLLIMIFSGNGALEGGIVPAHYSV